MNGAFYIGATGLDAQQRALEVVANNISNINTTGFKRSIVRFSDLVTARHAAANELVPTAATVEQLAGTSTATAGRSWNQGALRQTGRALDIAIDGAGFLELMGPAGRTLLWRGGSLKVNGDGYLTTVDGMPLRAMISVPLDATDIAIDRDGTVSVTTGGAEGAEDIGRIELVMAKDPDGLVAIGEGYFEARADADLYASPAGEDGSGTFVQGALEGANVQLSDEMVTLMLLQRAFAANAQVVQAGDQLMSIVNGLRR